VSAILFDTLRLFRTLRDKGHFSAEQAETLAEALGEAVQGDLATKADLAALKSELKGDQAPPRLAAFECHTAATDVRELQILPAKCPH
jgi:hypothetical protein